MASKRRGFVDEDEEVTSTMAGEAQETFYLGRQPIFDRQGRLRAYEILHRASQKNQADVADADADRTSALVLSNTFWELGIETVTDSKPAFINLTRRLLFEDLVSLFPARHFYLEILEDVVVDRDLISRVSALRGAGYRIVLDDFRFEPDRRDLLALADIVKLDIKDFSPTELAQEVDRLRRPGLDLLAEKIETKEELIRCRELDFDLFQGYILGRPVVLSGQRSEIERSALFSLLARINANEEGGPEFARAIESESALVERLHRILIARGLEGESRESLEDVLSRIGRTRFRAFVNLALLGALAPEEELIRARAALRGKMAERLAALDQVIAPSAAAVAGLFFGLAPLLTLDPAFAWGSLPLDDEVRSALEGKDGPLRDLLDVVRAYESGDLATLEASRYSLDTLRSAWLQSLDFARDAARDLDSSSS